MNRISFLNRGYAFKGLLAVVKCREEIASALNEFGNWWSKRVSVEDKTRKE